MSTNRYKAIIFIMIALPSMISASTNATELTEEQAINEFFTLTSRQWEISSGIATRMVLFTTTSKSRSL